MCDMITKMLRKKLRKDAKIKFHHTVPVPTLRNMDFRQNEYKQHR